MLLGCACHGVTAMKTLVSVVIPTYGRGEVLCDTIRALLALDTRAEEILVVDQTPHHDEATLSFLSRERDGGSIRWVRLTQPSITGAMNRGVLEARGDIVLFLDDDIVPHRDVITAHRKVYETHHDVWAVAGRVLQPEDQNRECVALAEGKASHQGSHCADRNSLTTDCDFSFSGNSAGPVANVMAGNLSVRRERFLEIGGFDENFGPPVAYRFETEFAKRMINAGGLIWFEPAASINHRRAPSGGTRSKGSHLSSASPIHGVGDYYYALRQGKGLERVHYMLRRPFREVRTKFHLRHPWYIPVKFIGEIRAIALAVRLCRRKPGLLSVDDTSDRDD